MSDPALRTAVTEAGTALDELVAQLPSGTDTTQTRIKMVTTRAVAALNALEAACRAHPLENR
jgi:hypothetical protein